MPGMRPGISAAGRKKAACSDHFLQRLRPAADFEREGGFFFRERRDGFGPDLRRRPVGSGPHSEGRRDSGGKRDRRISVRLPARPGGNGLPAPSVKGAGEKALCGDVPVSGWRPWHPGLLQGIPAGGSAAAFPGQTDRPSGKKRAGHLLSVPVRGKQVSGGVPSVYGPAPASHRRSGAAGDDQRKCHGRSHFHEGGGTGRAVGAFSSCAGRRCLEHKAHRYAAG